MRNTGVLDEVVQCPLSLFHGDDLNLVQALNIHRVLELHGIVLSYAEQLPGVPLRREFIQLRAHGHGRLDSEALAVC